MQPAVFATCAWGPIGIAVGVGVVVCCARPVRDRLGWFAADLLMGAPIEYPQPASMPAVVQGSMERVLASFEATLAAKAPSLLARCRPGLEDERLDAISDEHGIEPPEELRALYRWRDGMAPDARGVPLILFSASSLPSLREVVEARAALRAQVAAMPA